ncbi:hypothetical protein F2Q69_00057017 [Brassica cretica]|uniref:Uncharacterized protein n=1 Tax=Brassica cretica TaxID=69181 RepID=A0A8S9N7T3_BRACR|nr:hypothetical protein F2Q69_00057017 [Brassica cretica]
MKWSIAINILLNALDPRKPGFVIQCSISLPGGGTKPIKRDELKLEVQELLFDGFRLLCLQLGYSSQIDKTYPLDFMEVGRVVVHLKREDGVKHQLGKVDEGALVSSKQWEGTNEEVAQVNEEVIVEKCVEAETQKKENPVGDKTVVTSDESSNWALVSPAKMGRSPVKANQTEVLHISASKFSVLSVEEEHEEGEILHISHQCSDAEAQLTKGSNAEGREVADEGITTAKTVVEQSSKVQEEGHLILNATYATHFYFDNQNGAGQSYLYELRGSDVNWSSSSAKYEGVQRIEL